MSSTLAASNISYSPTHKTIDWLVRVIIRGLIEEVDLAEHLLSCPQGTEVTNPLISCLSSQADNLTNKDVIQMKISTSESLEHPASWLVSTCLMYVWDERSAGRRAKLDVCRAELIARVPLLKRSRLTHFSLHNSAVLFEEALNLHFV